MIKEAKLSLFFSSIYTNLNSPPFKLLIKQITTQRHKTINTQLNIQKLINALLYVNFTCKTTPEFLITINIINKNYSLNFRKNTT